MSTLTKTITVLQAIASAKPSPRFSDLLAVLDFPQTTLHRLLSQLIAEGLVVLDSHNKTYRLGLALLTLAQQALAGLDVREMAQAEIDELANLTQDTIHLAILDHDEIMYIDKRESSVGLRLYSAIGKRAPIYCTGVGKVIFSFLPSTQQQALLSKMPFVQHTDTTLYTPELLMQAAHQIKEQGYGFDIEEHEPGICCVAAPVFGLQQEVVAALSVTASVFRMPLERRLSLVPIVCSAAARVSEKLGFDASGKLFENQAPSTDN